jgi:hypothetical protein
MRRKSTVFAGMLVLLALCADAGAETTSGRRFEITPYVGGVWSRGYDVLLGGQIGNLGTKGSVMWGVLASYNIPDSLTQIELLYNRQDTEMTAEFAEKKTNITGVSVEYVQVGGLLGIQRVGTVWFTSFSLGAGHLRLAPLETTGSDAWRFAIIFGLGAKRYFNDRIGLRAQLRAPYMFVQDSASFICSDSGCLKSGGGRGIWQFDLSLGLVVRL